MQTYTKAERKGIAEALRAAKPFLWDGIGWMRVAQCYAICFALRRSGHPMSFRAETVVMNRLRRYSVCTVHSYVRIVLQERDLKERDVQQFRHRWLDALIEEFSQ